MYIDAERIRVTTVPATDKINEYEKRLPPFKGGSDLTTHLTKTLIWKNHSSLHEVFRLSCLNLWRISTQIEVERPSKVGSVIILFSHPLCRCPRTPHLELIKTHLKVALRADLILISLRR